MNFQSQLRCILLMICVASAGMAATQKPNVCQITSQAVTPDSCGPTFAQSAMNYDAGGRVDGAAHCRVTEKGKGTAETVPLFFYSHPLFP